jgi:hypothetical protein
MISQFRERIYNTDGFRCRAYAPVGQNRQFHIQFHYEKHSLDLNQVIVDRSSDPLLQST